MTLTELTVPSSLGYSSSPMISNIVHFELPVSHLENSKLFFSKLFGWKYHAVSPTYWVMTGEGQMGGLYEEPLLQKSGVRSCFMPTLYFSVENIEVTLELAQSLGAEIETPKTELPRQHGFFAIFTDLDKNRIGIWNRH